MSKIIALAGRKQSGKTTSAEMVVDFFSSVLGTSEGIKIYNFADPLKQDICMNILGLSYEQCYGSDEDKNQTTDLEWGGKKLTCREVMQLVGTDLFRKIKNNVWTEATINKIKKENPKLAIIADCRFPNEVERIQKEGGLVIKLTRNPFDSNHESECALDNKNYDHKNFDLVIFNNHLSIQQKNYAILSFLRKKGILTL
jgi:hypothetical protein